MRVTAITSHGPVLFESQTGQVISQPDSFPAYIQVIDVKEYEVAKDIDCHCHWPEEVDIVLLGYWYLAQTTEGQLEQRYERPEARKSYNQGGYPAPIQHSQGGH